MSSSLSHWPPGSVAALEPAGAVLRTWGDGYGYALVATGRVAAMVDPTVAPYDIGPMPVLLAEAGGRFTDLDGEASIEHGSGVATNGHLHDELLAGSYGSADPGRRRAVGDGRRADPLAPGATRDRIVPIGTSHTSAASA